MQSFNSLQKKSMKPPKVRQVVRGPVEDTEQSASEDGEFNKGMEAMVSAPARTKAPPGV